MNNSLTIVIPNRNRDLNTIKRSIASIVPQLNSETRLVLVDYGSKDDYQQELSKLINFFSNVELILCPTQGQLWNKSRCINIVLKTCETSHLMVCDMDMIWHPEFIGKQLNKLSKDVSVYFTIGIMTQEESALDKPFEDYQIKFQTDQEATGISIFPSEHLKSIKSFDEFYHGWGSEDTDMHMRLRNAGYEVRFSNSEVLFKHQWHAKAYRNKNSADPYHGVLEKINQQYLVLTKELGISIANDSKGSKWGILPSTVTYLKLENPDMFLNINHLHSDVSAALLKLSTLRKICVEVTVNHHSQKKTIKTLIKKILRKKTLSFISADVSNEKILEKLIDRYRNYPYKYEYSRKTGEIKFVINILD